MIKKIILRILILLLLIFIFSIVLTGCSRQPEYKIVYKEKIVKLSPPKYLIKDNIELPRPPSKLQYINANPYNRERLLTKYLIDLLGTIRKYKLKIENINNWNVNTGKIVDKSQSR
jgi:hypothetical protein